MGGGRLYTLLIDPDGTSADVKAWLGERGDGNVVPVERDAIAAMFVRGSDPPSLIVRVGTDGLEESALLRVSIEGGMELPPMIVLCDPQEALELEDFDEPALHAIDSECTRSQFLRALDRIVATDDSRVALTLHPSAETGPLRFGAFIGDSPAMKRVYAWLRRAGPSPSPALITGESGTGKELAARALHKLSTRKGAFIAINCGAVPENLIEDYLFGHAKGAFTGAMNSKSGLFEEADGGTIFLDEIGEMPPALQVRLLRVLQERVVQRVGESRDRPVDVRVIAATHRDLRSDIAEKRFREDLFHRLAVLPLVLPPLRERGEDLGLLVEHLGRLLLRENQRGPVEVTRGFLRALERHPWTGNVRELHNALAQAVVFHDVDRLTVEHLPATIRPAGEEEDEEDGATFGVGGMPALPDHGMNINEFLDRVQASLIRQALTRTSYNTQAAADLLGLARTTLFTRCKKLGVETSP